MSWSNKTDQLIIYDGSVPGLSFCSHTSACGISVGFSWFSLSCGRKSSGHHPHPTPPPLLRSFRTSSALNSWASVNNQFFIHHCIYHVPYKMYYVGCLCVFFRLTKQLWMTHQYLNWKSHLKTKGKYFLLHWYVVKWITDHLQENRFTS